MTRAWMCHPGCPSSAWWRCSCSEQLPAKPPADVDRKNMKEAAGSIADEFEILEELEVDDVEVLCKRKGPVANNRRR